jgi:hypothetical protein
MDHSRRTGSEKTTEKANLCVKPSSPHVMALVLQIIAGTLIVVTNGHAQTIGQIAQAQIDAENNKRQRDTRQLERDPVGKSGFTLPEPEISFETTKGKGRAHGTIGFAHGATNFRTQVSSPIGDSQDAEAQPLDLTGLTDGATVEFSITHASLLRAFNVEDIVRLCTDAGIAKEDCTAGKLQDTNSPLSQALLKRVFRDHPFVFGASVRFGRNTFAFVDAQGTAQAPRRKNDVGVEGSFGWLLSRRTRLLALHLQYSSDYQASPDTTELCRPLSGTTVVRCDPAVVGEPNHARAAIATMEYKWQVAREDQDGRSPGGPVIGFGPRLQLSKGLDEADDIMSFELPVYFFQEKLAETSSRAPKLNGGLSAGWRSDTGFQAYVFIGTAFRLLELN